MYILTNKELEQAGTVGNGVEGIKLFLGESPPTPRKCNNQDIPPLTTIIPFTPDKVYGTCIKRGVFGVPNPVDIIAVAIARAVEMLDNTINELVNARNAVCAGRTPAWPLLGDITADWLINRLGICINDIRVWTAGTLVNKSVAEVIRRLTRIRNIIASNAITYVCHGPLCGKDWWAYIRTTEPRIIRLCRSFWILASGVDPKDHAEFQAQTIIHEASHLYYDTVDKKGSSIGVAECLTQFVAATNGSPIDPDFATRCRVTNRCPASSVGHLAGSELGIANPGSPQIARTVFHPERAIRLKGRLTVRR